MNHTSAASGAEFALMRLVGAVRRRHHVAVACPPSGPLADMLDDAAVEHVPIPAFEASLRLDPLQTPVNLARLGAGGVALARAARRFDADLLHANTPRAGLIGALATRVGGPPLVVRAHEHLPLNAVGRGVRYVLGRSANAIVTVSRETERRFNEGLERPLATHVYNSFDRERFDPGRAAATDIRAQLGIAPDAPLLGHVAQITPWKGQDTSIRTLAELRRQGVDAHLLIVGEIAFAGKGVRYDNPAYLRGLHRLVEQLALADSVHFVGQRQDVPGILRELDLSLLPSWDEPFANVMLESMAMGTPMLVSSVGGGPELVEDGVSGRVLAPKRPELWAAAARDLLADPRRLAQMGASARKATNDFSDEAHARDMLDVYEYVLAREDADPADVAAMVPRRRHKPGPPPRRCPGRHADRDEHRRARGAGRADAHRLDARHSGG
ncbi:MAG: L-malate glycosyltransferase [Thermoleophilaceae bacterium]|nr:L-malate glycosyltransferase [Thermoleophilaceae bacterium]